MTAIAVPTEAADQQTFGYDSLDRPTSAALTGSAVNLGYGYDVTGNRTQEVRNGATSQYTMAATSNRLLSISGSTSRTMSYDADGSITSDRGVTFTYDGRERLVGAGATTYYVNGLGQRIEKAGPGANTASGIRQFVYDEQGRLLAEYDAGSGAPIAEHIYFNDWPVGLMQGGTTYYVHPDHLGAPRTITRSTDNQTMWTWQREPFGAGVIQPPSGFEYNLRFPGQYFDAETGLHYNYFRDYDPTIGKYEQSDPIGLEGGTNTYAYVKGNPLGSYDPYGLWSWGDPIDQRIVDFGTGFGETFLIPKLIRDTFGIDGSLNRCSGWYSGGAWTGIAWGMGMGGIGLARGGLRFEMGNWKQGGEWFFREGTRGPHSHWGTGAGLQNHRLPWQASNWWRNFIGLAKRGQAGDDLKNLGLIAGGAAVATSGAVQRCGCD